MVSQNRAVVSFRFLIYLSKSNKKGAGILMEIYANSARMEKKR